MQFYSSGENIGRRLPPLTDKEAVFALQYSEAIAKRLNNCANDASAQNVILAAFGGKAEFKWIKCNRALHIKDGNWLQVPRGYYIIFRDAEKCAKKISIVSEAEFNAKYFTTTKPLYGTKKV
jgi:hypothetical protein